MKKIKIFTDDMTLRERLDLRAPFFISVALNFIVVTALALVLLQERSILTRYKTMVVEKLVEDIPLTDSAIVHELTQMGCVLPAVALAQFKVETGHFTSAICKENKNIAGIRTSRSQYVRGVNRGHCVYNTYRDCLRDYVRVQNAYLKNIEGRYAETKGYTNNLKQIK